MLTQTTQTTKTALAKPYSLKLVAIGNSQGLRLPRPLLNKYGLHGSVSVRECDEGLLLLRAKLGKVSLDQTFAEMTAENKLTQNAVPEWGAFDGVMADGLESLPW